MYDRMIRADLYTSNRYVDLHDDSQRVLFHVLVARADDFGCQSGDLRELLRDVYHCTQLHSLEALTAALQSLADQDLVRLYEVGTGYDLHDARRWREYAGRPGIYIPRFRSQRSYSKRHFAPSPWCDQQALEGQVRQRYGDMPTNFVPRAQRRNATTDDKTATDLPQGHDRSAADMRQDDRHKETTTTLRDSPKGQALELTANGQDSAADLRRPAADLPMGWGGEGFIDNRAPKKSKRTGLAATRLTEAWTIPTEWLAWSVVFALDKGFDIGSRGAADLALRFHAHYLNKHGPEGEALDWFAKWRTWCSRAEGFGELAKLAQRNGSATGLDQPDAIARAR